MQLVLDVFSYLVFGIEGVGEAKVGYYDVAVTIQQQIFQFQVSMNDTLCVKVADSRNELSEKSSCGRVFQVAMIQNVVEELAARSILQDDADVPFRLHHFMQAYDVRVLETSQYGYFPVDFGQPARIGSQRLSPYQFDGHLDPPSFFQPILTLPNSPSPSVCPKM